MNSTYFAQLPRFDAPDFNVTETVADSVQDPPAVRDAPAPAPLSEPEPADLGALLADIVRAADARGAAIRNLAADMTERLARVLFPRLAEDFLAREIALCIPALLPDPPLVLTVRAPSRAAASLGALVAGAGIPPRRCAIFVHAEPSDTHISFDWSIGGVDFDFDAALDACLANLTTQFSHTETKP
jgi:hypothetical protein